jgi:hypothetical protein
LRARIETAVLNREMHAGHHCRENVVQVVRHAAGELADRIELLRFTELRVAEPIGRDIAFDRR